jgi:cation-transporting ATPase 13A1
MTVIVNIEDSKNSNSGDYKVLPKGAPEVIRRFLKEVPQNYDKSYLKYVKSGARVLALAYKNLPRTSAESYV